MPDSKLIPLALIALLLLAVLLPVLRFAGVIAWSYWIVHLPLFVLIAVVAAGCAWIFLHLK